MFAKILTAVLALTTVTSDRQFTSTPVPPEDGLRLVVTSPEDPGAWITEDEKISKFVSKRLNFADITDS